MTGWQIGLLIGGVLLVDAVIVATLLRAASAGWNRLADRHPPSEPTEPNETRRFQSFAFGIFNLGFSIHVTVDETKLHLTPVRPLRALGMRAASLPWDAIELKPRGWRKSWRTAKLGGAAGLGTDLHGPAWCLELAERPA